MKSRLIFALAVLAIFCAARTLAAEEVKFALRKTSITLPESMPMDAFTLETEDHELTFIPPHEARVFVDDKKREVRFNFRDDRCLITLKHSEVGPAMVMPAGWDQLRSLMRERYPDAEVSEASACQNSCGGHGCSFTIRQNTGYMSIKLVTRLSFIPVEGGMLEVSMTANGNKFPAQQVTFNNFLNCLRLERTGLPKTGLANN